MALLIPHNVTSRNEINPAHRRVAKALKIALDEAATVWYEPSYDPKGKRPHFVVLLPERGIVVLEVLKAAKVLGAFRGKIRLERDGQEIEVANPLERAQELCEILRQRIATEDRLASARIPVGAGAVFTSLPRQAAFELGLGRIIPEDSCLFKEDINPDSGSITQILKVFSKILESTEEFSITRNQKKVLRGIIQPDTVIGAFKAEGVAAGTGMIFGPSENEGDIVRVLNRRQEAIAKSLGGGHRVIRGVAGSGKTLVLVYRARLLSRFPKSRILVTCYTRSLASLLRELLRQNENVHVVNLDKLMAATIKSAGLSFPGFDDNGDAVARAALRALEKGHGPQYDAVLVDEAQDFNNDALRFIVGMLAQGKDDLVVVADAAQNIFKRKFSWKSAGINAQGRTRILRTNYRNTKEILKFAYEFLIAGGGLQEKKVPDLEDEHAIVPPEAAVRSGSPPTVVACSDVDKEIQQAAEKVQKWSADLNERRAIAVLYASSFQNGGYNFAAGLHETLHGKGLATFWMNNPEDPNAKDSIASANEKIILSTIHSAKGLEFPRVLLCGLGYKEDDPDTTRMLIYVGMTRATDHLAVLARRGTPIFHNLRKLRDSKADCFVWQT